ncbi:AAA family ATPase [Lujinxingia vulgaris]|uniref:AAA family ATPase n=1 Tax=Lujinxingia vulgaris TaxID=2600176 RepID=A0A5C6XK93_9DELT|nr:AAA family ATPase [Lujinxingia vulgaris]TXD37726.1 AAA family ATPase [Lujinxingia vulgaris]
MTTPDQTMTEAPEGIRQHERDALAAMLNEPAARVAVYGPPGVGKSHLAEAAARRWAHAFNAESPPPVAWVDARTAQPGASFYDELVHALELAPVTEFDRARVLDQIARVLSERGPLLLVFDDADRVAPEVNAFLERVRDCAELRVLLTSRVVMPEAAVRAFSLSPLSPEDAHALFVQAARRARQDYDPGEVPDGVLRALLERLDHLPLAIVLAAARQTIMSTEGLLQRLEKRFQILRPAHAPGERSRRALGEAIGLSWDLLDEVERRTLSQCAVFAGPFDLKAAEAIVDTGSDAAWVGDVLQSLVMKSLIETRQNEARGELSFRVLESIADFGRQNVDAQLLDEAARRHSDYYEALASELDSKVRGPQGERALQRLVMASANLSAAVDRLRPHAPWRARRLLYAMLPTFEVRGLLGAYLDRFDSLRALHPELPMSAREALIRAQILRTAGRLNSALEAIETSQSRINEPSDSPDAAESPPDSPSLAEVMLERGLILADLGRMRESGEVLLSGSQTQGEPFVELNLEHERGRYQLNSARLGYFRDKADADAMLNEAVQRLRVAYEASHQHTHTFYRARISVGWAVALHEQGKTGAALGVLRDAIDAQQSHGYRTNVLNLTYYQALLNYYLGDMDRALAISAELDRGCAQMGLAVLRARNASSRATYAMAAGRVEEARELIDHAISLCDAHAQDYSALIADNQAVLCAWELGATDAFPSVIRRALARAERVGSQVHVGIISAYRLFYDVSQSPEDPKIVEARAQLPECIQPLSQAGELRRPTTSPRWIMLANAWQASLELHAAAWHLEQGDFHMLYDAIETIEALKPRLKDPFVTVYVRHALQLASATRQRYALPEERPEHMLRVSEGGDTVRLDDGEPIDLSSRAPLRRLLLALIERARAGEPSADMDAVIAAGWPGEQIEPRSAANRVYSTVRMLRNLGLGEVIVTDDVGYRVAEGVLIIGHDAAL